MHTSTNLQVGEKKNPTQLKKNCGGLEAYAAPELHAKLQQVSKQSDLIRSALSKTLDEMTSEGPFQSKLSCDSK